MPVRDLVHVHGVLNQDKARIGLPIVFEHYKKERETTLRLLETNWGPTI
jgi:hypothetical protein